MLYYTVNGVPLHHQTNRNPPLKLNEMKTIKEISEIIYNLIMDDDSIDTDTSIGLRVMNEEYSKEGISVVNSNRWEDGNDTGEELAGASCIQIHTHCSYFDAEDIALYLRKVVAYHGVGNTLSLIVGDNHEGGEDSGEIVISNAKIKKVICKIDEIDF